MWIETYTSFWQVNSYRNCFGLSRKMRVENLAAMYYPRSKCDLELNLTGR